MRTLAGLTTRHLDVALATLMALAAMITAWATYEGSQWDSVASDARSASALLRADAGRAASDGVTQSVVDATIWVEWEKAVTLNRDELAGFLRERFSSALDVAQDEWLRAEVLDADGNPVDNTLPKGTPLDLDSYVPRGQVKAEGFAADAENKMAEAAQAGEVSTRYTLQAVMLAMVLFFGAVATKFSGLRIQIALTLLAVGILSFVVLRMAGMPVI